jgi:hypothetical protein
MMDIEGNFVGQVCHIEGAEEGGERFNPEMSNEDRRSAANLMLMCYPHHVVTNDVTTYTVEKLRKIKVDHERRFSDPQRVILETLTDWTAVDAPKPARTLNRMRDVLGWEGLGAEHLKESADEINAYANRLQNVPQGVRKFLGAVAMRAYKMRKTNAVQTSSPMFSGTRILGSDIEGALHLTPRAIMARCSELDAYNLGDLSEIWIGELEHPAVRIADLKSGWALWMDIAEFCNKANEPIDAFTVDLDFKRLD